MQIPLPALRLLCTSCGNYCVNERPATYKDKIIMSRFYSLLNTSSVD